MHWIMGLMAAATFANAIAPAQQSPSDDREKYELRVPNERRSAVITVEIRFPTGLHVTAVEQKPGWQAEAVRNSSGGLTGVRWIGNLPPEEFTEFGLLGAGPAKAGEPAFTIIEAFADGTKVEWSGTASPKAQVMRIIVRSR